MSADTDEPRFLPLGSFVKVKNRGERLFVIVARALAKGEDDVIRTNYRLAPHPTGYMKPSDIVMDTDMNVVEVIQEGYSDEEDDAAFSDKFEKTQMIHSASSAPKGDIPEPDLSHLLDMGAGSAPSRAEVAAQDDNGSDNDDQRLLADPFYKFKQGR